MTTSCAPVCHQVHCLKCGVCVENHDHHCGLLGCCVGSHTLSRTFSIAPPLATTPTLFPNPTFTFAHTSHPSLFTLHPSPQPGSHNRRCFSQLCAASALAMLPPALHALTVTYSHGRVALAALASVGVPGEAYMQLSRLTAPLGWLVFYLVIQMSLGGAVVAALIFGLQQLIYVLWRRGALRDGAGDNVLARELVRAAGLRSWGAVGAAQENRICRLSPLPRNLAGEVEACAADNQRLLELESQPDSPPDTLSACSYAQ